MNRLTHERCSGIKPGYWSPQRKEILIDRLGQYEDTGLTPVEILELKSRHRELLKAAEESR
ncbi:hypothetical protein AAA088_09915 [Hominifimenecus microfluidus]|uniref:hypothetical protein n=1 Tax=Hominifimenecus microfluidus TaxID=2885348 RepID=UPI002046F090|nr:MAG TPA: hypothetical protein [Caudoviricetes sp.]